MLIVLLAIALSDGTYRYIEQPARHGFRRWTPAWSVLAATGTIAFMTLMSYGIVWTGGLPGRLPQVVADFEREQAHDTMTTSCLPNEQGVARLDCVIGAPGTTRKTFLVWGDSHADVLSPAISGAASRRGLKGVAATRVSCAPVFVTAKAGGPYARTKCIDMAAKVEEALAPNDITDVILIARWAKYLEGTEMQAGELVHNRFFEGSEHENRDRFANLLRQTIARITATGRRVTLVGPIPELRDNLPNAMTRAMMTGGSVSLDVPRARFDERNRFVLQVLKHLATSPGVRLVLLHPKLCNDNACMSLHDGRLLYIDDNHLGKAGIDMVRPSIDDALAFGGSAEATRPAE
jgi:hypothetical protein